MARDSLLGFIIACAGIPFYFWIPELICNWYVNWSPIDCCRCKGIEQNYLLSCILVGFIILFGATSFILRLYGEISFYQGRLKQLFNYL